MKLCLLTSPSTVSAALFLALTAAGCSGTTNPLDGPGSPSAPPHALGVITLGEAHLSGQSSSSPLVSATFIPDSSVVKTCSQSLEGGCTMPALAQCDGTHGSPVCQGDQVCALDDSCSPTCLPACTATCGTGEVCYQQSNGAQSCRAVQSFDAGALAFAGTTMPITLFPPYSFEPTSEGAPFLAGKQLEVQAAGAAGAGFQPFDATFQATTFLQTSPALTTLDPATIFQGNGTVPVGWVKGSDSVVVSITGQAGTASCPATDASGTFAIPRSVIAAVLGNGAASGLAISVSRQRVETKTGEKTQGTLDDATVQPVGYLELTTSSTESASFVAPSCANGQEACADGCQNLLTSPTDCGACGNSCAGSACEDGECVPTTTGSTCATGETLCNAACVDTLTSSANCGTCGYSCGATEYCSGGDCYANPITCASGETPCNGACVDTSSSATNCGSCGNACASGETCVNGACSGGTTDTCASCQQAAEQVGGGCASPNAVCLQDPNCEDYGSCISGCTAGDTTCEDSCSTDYPNGQTEFTNLQSCLCNTACATQCLTDASCLTSVFEFRKGR